VDIPPNERLNRARVCRDTLDFDCAERELAAARSAIDLADHETQIAIYRLSAEMALSTQHFEAARDHMAALLRLEPGFRADPARWPPDWRKRLEEVRATLPDDAPPVVGATLPSAPRVGEPVSVEAVITDTSGVSRAEIVLAGTPPVRLAMTPVGGDTWQGEIPAALCHGVLSFWIEAYDTRGNGPGLWARPEAPFRLALAPTRGDVPPPAEQASILTSPWFWTVVGAAAVGAGVGIGLGVREATNDPRQVSGTPVFP